MNSLALLCGLGLGSLDWWALYYLYKKVFLKQVSFEGFWRKFAIANLFILKTLILFAVLYLVVVVFRLNVVYFLTGLLGSLTGAVLILYMKVKRSGQ